MHEIDRERRDPQRVPEHLAKACGAVRGGGQIDEEARPRAQRERDRGVRERERRDGANDGPELAFSALEELAAGGNGPEEVLDDDARPLRMARGMRRRRRSPVRHDLRAEPRVVGRRREDEPGNRRDRGQRFPAKAHRRDAREVVEGPDLRRRVPLERERRVLGPHSGAVVENGDSEDAAALDVDGDAARARVERVLDELLHRRGGPLDDLARGDLVHEGGGEDADGPGHDRDVIGSSGP